MIKLAAPPQMLIKIGYELVFDVRVPVPMQLMLYLHPDRVGVLQKSERLKVFPEVPVQSYIDMFGNRVGRLVAPAGKLRICYDNVAEDSGRHEPRIDGARLHRVEELPPECTPFLLASRYCEVDKMTEIAWDLFGKTPPTWERVQAVMDWVHDNVTFGYQFARPTKSAMEVYQDRKGVCRDFMHLAITLLRALNVPARYATGYLGDIGVPPAPFAMDFSAWFEVYLGDRWYTLDARHNEPRIGRILQARGRDAVDVALTTSFGPAKLEKFRVWTEEVQ
ncbi:MAG: Transglutaminase [Phycisphaerales bacterium]|nr:Transglutaminase [Phycisphaerales bacterium]